MSSKKQPLTNLKEQVFNSLKTGAPARGERVEKYNQPMRIQEKLGEAGVHARRMAFVR